MNSNSSDLMSYCLLTKKNFIYKKAIRAAFFYYTFQNREYFVFIDTIRDTLRHEKSRKLIEYNTIKFDTI